MSALIRDVRYALRGFITEPGFTLTTVLSLALGIGATTAIFTVADSILLRPLPYKDSDRLVAVLRGPDGTGPVSPADFLDYRRAAQSFTRLAAAQAWSGTLGGGIDPAGGAPGAAERIAGLQVSADMFELLGVQPLIGRTFVEGEDEAGRDEVVVLGHSLWRRRFGADPAIVGRSVSIDAQSYQVVGVMPPTFRFAPFWQTRAEMWRPLSLERRLDDRAGRSLRLFGRLKDGVTVGQAQAELTAIAARLEQTYPQTNTGVGGSVQPLLERVVSSIRPTLLALMATVTFVLLIACANVSNALLARASARRKEIGLRIAIGASQWQVVRQLLTESVLLALAGQALGVLGAMWGLGALLGMLPPASLPRQDEVAFDGRIFLAASGVTLAAGILTGLLPAVQVVRRRVAGVLEGAGRGLTDSAARKRVARALVGAEVMLAVVLLAGAGLMLQTMLKLRAVDPGFSIESLAVANVSLGGTPHAAPQARSAMFLRIRDALSAMPGVTSVSAINHLPLAGDVWTLGYTIEGRPEPPPGQQWGAVYRIVQPGYFATTGVPLLAGRDFAPADGPSAPHVAIVNRAMADRRWPGESPIGRRIFVRGLSGVTAPIAIVGVAANARQSDWTTAPDDEVYLAYDQRASEFGLSAMAFVLRTSTDPARIAAAVPGELALVDPGLAVYDNTTMSAVAADELWRERLTAELTAIFGMVALALAAIGVYAVVAYSVVRRTRELGVRLALGATRARLLQHVLADALSPVLLGAAAGVLAAVLTTRLIRTLLFGVSPLDPVALGGATLMLVLVAAAAAYLPARRASRLDPVAALRGD